jgi:hypothetical protein
VYVQRNTDARYFNHYFTEKAMSITKHECVFVALDIQYAIRMRHTAICDLFGLTIFFYIISQTARFTEKKIIEHEMCVSSFCAIFI